MRKLKSNQVFLILCLFITVSAHAEILSSIYFEGSYLNTAATFASLVVPKAGWVDHGLGLEVYATARTGMDSRTFIERSDAIYNDNYLFLAGGVDYTKLIPGVRLSLQVGQSFDLNPKIHLGGFDIRSGFMTYHEIEWVPLFFRNEIYSEGFYVRRYKNVIADLHLRSFLTAWKSEGDRYHGFEVGPYLNLLGSYDTADYDYNRFLEAQYGARIQYHSPVTLGFHVLGVLGHRSEGDIRNYSDFRLLLTTYWEY